ncbi:MAG: hypothetical protein NVSMB62_15850 [Acidobacteriaceae bacterium]
MKYLKCWIPVALLIALSLGLPAYAQKTTGVVFGQVTDSSGAVLPNATVSLKNSSTGFSRDTSTNSTGEYRFEDIPNATYTIDVSSPSFRRFVADGVVVNVASLTRVDAKLTVGNVSETVEVSASAVQVETESGALGTVVDGTQVKELPLNGRSFVELTQLGPGVSGANNFDSKNKGLQGGVDFSVNGNPTTNNLFLVDGANDNDVGSNRTILIYPSIESIAEFKMLTNSYGPEYGQASGAVISIVTRAGTNAFHGSLFYSGRNDALAAYSFFARRNTGLGLPLNGKDKLRRNDYGYSIGGPILKDKLFFFFNQEINHEIRGITQSGCVASAAERAGDFSNVTCGATQPTFPVALQKNGNPHALNAVDPAGTLLAKYFTLPNKSTDGSGNNWSQSLPTFLKYRQENARVDFNLTKHNTLMGRYTQDTWSNPSYNGNQYWGDTAYPVVNANWAQPSKMMIGRWTSTITDTLVNDAEFAYSNNRINISPGGTDPTLLTQLSAAIPSLYSQSLKTASASTPTVWAGLGPYGNYNSIWSIAPWNNTLDIYTMRDDVSKVAGHHALKLGAFVGINGKNEDSSAASTERPTFQTFDYAVVQSIKDPVTGVSTPTGSIATGNNLANVLVPNQVFNLAENSTNVRAQLRWKDIEAYAGDTWKLTPRITLNYGARYSLLYAPVQPNDQITSFQPQLYDPSKPASDACNGLWVAPGKDPCGDANRKFGTKFSSGVQGPSRSLVYNNNHLISPRLGVAWDVFGTGKTSLRLGFGQFYQRERISRYTLVANAPFSLAASNVPRRLGGATPATLGAGSASPQGGYDPRAILPSSYQWNLTVEQELAKNTVLQVSYVGNRGTHLTSSYDVNYIPAANRLAATFTQNPQSLRRFPNYGSLSYWTHNGDSYYHSLQTLFRTQIGSLRMQAAYTWSHAIANVLTDDSSGGIGAGSFTDPTNTRLDRGNTATNRPNIFVANATYFLPKLQSSGLLTRNMLGGWELSGITNADSGNSFTIYQTGVNDAHSVPAGSTYGPVGTLFQTGLTGMQRPLINPNQPCNGKGNLRDQIINPQAFTLVGYHLGTEDPRTAPRGSCSGPRLVNTDLSLDKNWRVHERVTIQFRLDAFDAFNHANFRQDNGFNGTAINTISCGTTACSPVNNVVTSETRNGNFGRSTSLVGNAGRQFQYGLHVEF